MNKEIIDLMNDGILERAGKSFSVLPGELKLKGLSQNFVYEYSKGGEEFILRITHSSHRSEDEVKEELNFINYLALNNLSVSKPLSSKSGNLTERIECNDGYFTVVAFIKAQGNQMSYPEFINNEGIYESCGDITGSLHALSKKYKPSAQKRHDWANNYYLKSIKEESFLYKEYQNIIKDLEALDKNHENYGLIHGDINVGNFFLHEDSLILFDFDECQYSWFAEDIAIELFYAVYVFLNDSRADREKCAENFMKNFMKGYERKNHLKDKALKEISLFLRLREIILYRGMEISLDMNDLNEWTRTYVSESRNRIENHIPIVENIIY